MSMRKVPDVFLLVQPDEKTGRLNVIGEPMTSETEAFRQLALWQENWPQTYKVLFRPSQRTIDVPNWTRELQAEGDLPL